MPDASKVPLQNQTSKLTIPMFSGFLMVPREIFFIFSDRVYQLFLSTKVSLCVLAYLVPDLSVYPGQ